MFVRKICEKVERDDMVLCGMVGVVWACDVAACVVLLLVQNCPWLAGWPLAKEKIFLF